MYMYVGIQMCMYLLYKTWVQQRPCWQPASLRSNTNPNSNAAMASAILWDANNASAQLKWTASLLAS